MADSVNNTVPSDDPRRPVTAAGRRALIETFQRRLLRSMESAEMSRAALAAEAGLDRSTLTQLLAAGTVRLPRADTVAALAMALNVSADWLLGLSGEEGRGGTVIDDLLEVALRPRSATPADEHLARWYRDAAGYKIRFVPSNLPDPLKTDAVLQHEYQRERTKTPDQAIAASTTRLEYIRLPETDMEICLERQALEQFARGEGVWTGLGAPARREQLEAMAVLSKDLYPGLRIYAYDGMSHYSAPYTVFGPVRVALYVGRMYLVLNTTEHVRLFSRHFDELVRDAAVRAHRMPEFLAGLRGDVA